MDTESVITARWLHRIASRFHNESRPLFRMRAHRAFYSDYSAFSLDSELLAGERGVDQLLDRLEYVVAVVAVGQDDQRAPAGGLRCEDPAAIAVVRPVVNEASRRIIAVHVEPESRPI